MISHSKEENAKNYFNHLSFGLGWDGGGGDVQGEGEG